MTPCGWRVEWVLRRSGFSSYEVFTDPQGTEWVRAGSPETTELTIPMQTPSVPDLRLKKRSRPFGKVA